LALNRDSTHDPARIGGTAFLPLHILRPEPAISTPLILDTKTHRQSAHPLAFIPVLELHPYFVHYFLDFT